MDCPILGIDGNVLLDAPPPEMSRELIERLLDGRATCANEYVGYAIMARKYPTLHRERLKRRARRTRCP